MLLGRAASEEIWLVNCPEALRAGFGAIGAYFLEVSSCMDIFG
jgi:hypothetical protein